MCRLPLRDRVPTGARECYATNSNTLLQRIESPSHRVAELSAKRNRHSKPRNRRPHNKSNSRYTAVTPCRSHRRFRARAQQCIQACAYHQQGTLAQQTSAAAYVYTTITRRLFVTDRHSKQQFLIDTGSGVCVFPASSSARTKRVGLWNPLTATPTRSCVGKRKRCGKPVHVNRQGKAGLHIQ